MRSGSSSVGAQDELPLGPLPRAESGARPVRGRASADEAPRYRLRNDALASRGWPHGTELVVQEGRRPQRGEVALVVEGGRLRIGVFDVRFGRGMLRTDHGSTLLGASARFVGVVTQAGPPLEGMPEVPA